ncbi:MAG TPA: hypothetical protein VIC06_06615 [Solirubrobacteraceae bacterium]
MTFFVGSIFFTSASYLQYSEAVNVEHSLGTRVRRRWRPVSWEPRRIDWLAASVQLLGSRAAVQGGRVRRPCKAAV